jgi:hypothetical protein
MMTHSTPWEGTEVKPTKTSQSCYFLQMVNKSKRHKQRFIWTPELERLFLGHLDDIALTERGLRIETEQLTFPALKLLSYHFFNLPGACAPITEHWNERRRAAREFCEQIQQQVACVNNLYLEEAEIQSRFSVYGSGRLFPYDGRVATWSIAALLRMWIETPCFFSLNCSSSAPYSVPVRCFSRQGALR